MSKANNGANLGFESKLWEMADKMRGHMDASEYKNVVLGLIFLKYISDAFQHKYDQLAATRETEYTDPEDRDEYAADNIFWVPPEARWERIQAQAPQPVIGKVIDEAMTAIERENPSLRGVLPKDYSRPTLDKTRLGELVKLVGDIDLKADYILANPPFNMSDWGGERLKEDVRWKYGVPPANNANYAWIQHFIHHLGPGGIAGFVMANGSMSTATTAELAIRKGIIEDDLVDCIIALPGQLFYTTQIPVCLWFLTRNKKGGRLPSPSGRGAGGEGLRSEGYRDKPGWWKSATLEEIREHGYVLTPGRYVGAKEVEDDGVPFEEKMAELTAQLYEQFDKSRELEATIRKNLEMLGFGGRR